MNTTVSWPQSVLTLVGAQNTSTECNMDYVGTAQGIFTEKSISNWARDHSSDILPKKVAAFCPYCKTQPEAKLKSF